MTNWKQTSAAQSPAILMVRCLLAGWAVLLVVVPIGAVRGQDGGAPPGATGQPSGADAAIDRFVTGERLRSGNAFLDKEVRRLRGAAQAGSAALAASGELLAPVESHPEIGPALERALKEGLSPATSAYQSALGKLRDEDSRLASEWRPIRRSLDKGRWELQLARQQRRAAASVATLCSLDDGLYRSCMVLTIGLLAGVIVHNRRHRLRRWSHAGRGRRALLVGLLVSGFAVLALFAAGAFVPAHETAASTLRTGRELGSEETGSPDVAGTELASLQQERQKLNRDCAAEWDKLAAALPGGTPVKEGKAYRQAALELHEEVSLSRGLASAMEADRQELDRVKQELATLDAEKTGDARARDGIRVASGLVLLGVSLGGGYWFSRWLGKEREKIANTCPLCLGENHLQPLAEETARTGEGPTGEANDASVLLQCHNQIQTPEGGEELCDYIFPAGHRALPKLCFPTLGIPVSGKTHWVAMLYHTLKQRNAYPETVKFRQVVTESSREFDRIVERILQDRMNPASTQHNKMPHPLVFHFQDNDRCWGRSDVLMSIFDLSGEVTASFRSDEQQRARALRADGFFLFLDPEKEIGDQVKAMERLCEDLRLIRGLAPSQQIGTPVAVCVSKMDKLTKGNPGQEIAIFLTKLRKVEREKKRLSWGRIGARSRLVGGLCSARWRGWNVERTIRDCFGTCYMFFPMTPVGFNVQDDDNLQDATIGPFGLLEPLWWLLHMNGYPVLS